MQPPTRNTREPDPSTKPRVSFIASSAEKRHKHPLGPGGWAALIVAALILTILVFNNRTQPVTGLQPPESAPVRPVKTHPQVHVPPPSPTPTPTWFEAESSPLVVTPPPSPSPTPLPTWTPRPTPHQAAAPNIADCVETTWTARQGEAPFNQVLIDIDATNRCGKTLHPLDIWFTISGWRHGGLVRSVKGHPFDPIGDDETGSVTIALPGSIDWYDRITVDVSGAHWTKQPAGQ